jgi:glyoxylase-like metal-dependent hydrolase (beta-lactamase superfamily II)
VLRPRELSRSLSLFAAKTPTLPPATHTNSYALGGRDVVLVEPATPYDDEQRAWIEWARALPSQGRTPIAIVATHHHIDHVGGIDVLSRELALPIWAHADTASKLDDVVVARTLADGDVIDLDGPIPERWSILHTPGHAWGHICLWNADSRTVVVGDMVASVGTILIAPGDGDMRIYLEQLERLALLDASVALPAHGDPVDTPATLFRHYVAHRLMREEKIARAVAASGPDGAPDHELVPIAYDDTPPHIWPFALLSLQAHLEKLVAEGRVAVRDGRYASAT